VEISRPPLNQPLVQSEPPPNYTSRAPDPVSDNPPARQTSEPPVTKPIPAPAPVQPVTVTPPQPTSIPPPADPPVAEPKVAAVAITDSDTDAFGLLLCGAGESGKTTFVRQLKLRCIPGGISESDRRELIPTIRGNLIETMQELLKWAEKHDLQLPDEYLESAQLVATTNPFGGDTFSVELIESLVTLWGEQTIQEAFEHKDETVIPDNMGYFFEKLETLTADDYLPSDDDILRARIRSIGIANVTFNLEGALIRIYDVGGQRNERAKWAQVMNETSGVIFCVSFADFDKPMFESLPEIEPRIYDAFKVYEDVVHKDKFVDAPFFLLCNKFDAFTAKVRNTDCFAKIFPEFQGDPHNEDECGKFLAQKFIEKADPQIPERPIIVYRQDALNGANVTENANRICHYIKEHYFEEA
jgi:GTPase SAR1 family protein